MYRQLCRLLLPHEKAQGAERFSRVLSGADPLRLCYLCFDLWSRLWDRNVDAYSLSSIAKHI